MKYYNEITLKDGRRCVLRNGRAEDAEELLGVFLLTHEQTDFQLTYPEENTFTAESEAEFLKDKEESENEIEILAVVDGKIVGSAGISSVGKKEKLKHRAEFGIGIDKDFWGLGIGKALTEACIECAKKAGYAQLELSVVGGNARALDLYRKAGFKEYGRNPRGFLSKYSGYQELCEMRLEL